jgi:hypothetical protein
MAYFLDKVGDVKQRAGKRTRNDFDEDSAVPALQQVLCSGPHSSK